MLVPLCVAMPVRGGSSDGSASARPRGNAGQDVVASPYAHTSGPSEAADSPRSLACCEYGVELCYTCHETGIGTPRVCACVCTNACVVVVTCAVWIRTGIGRVDLAQVGKGLKRTVLLPLHLYRSIRNCSALRYCCDIATDFGGPTGITEVPRRNASPACAAD